MNINSSSRKRKTTPTNKRALLSRTLVLFFSLNFISLLFLYFLLFRPRPPPPPPPPPPFLRYRLDQNDSSKSTLKPWPDLPSFLPWTGPNHNPTPRSCEAYFGNGFTRKVDVVSKPAGSGGERDGWFRCLYSETLRSSICEGGGIRMDPAKISMSAGGEDLEAVIGRGEEEELPKFQDGAFQIAGEWGRGAKGRRVVTEEFLDEYVPRGAVEYHTMRSLMGSMEFVSTSELGCSQWIDNPTLLVTRFEYANVFHTVTDWYSAYVSSRVTNLHDRPDLIFVDGHCKTQLEETWKALFSKITYVKNFTGPVCFRHAIFSPLGYETAMFKGLTESISCHGVPAHNLRENVDDHKIARLSEFGEMLTAAFGLPVGDHAISKPSGGHNVLFVRREDYLAHPRHDGKVQSRLSNEEEVYDSLKKWAANYANCKINLVNGLFAHMPMKDQLRAIQEASVVIGAHGAGLTHLVSASQNAKVLEIISSFYRRPHFSLISEWKGLDYHAINLAGSYAKPSEVIKNLASIMTSLGC